MKESRNKSIAIAGAGLVGSVVACYLAQRGYQVDIFERRADPRLVGSEHGRSINLALSNRGWLPLKEIGLESEVKKLIIPMNGRMMHDTSGELTFQPYGKEGQAINSISRGGLNMLLLNAAEKAGCSTHFNCQVEHVNFETAELKFRNGRTFSADIIIGADGAFSAIRSQMQRTDRFNYSQYFIDYGYKEMTMPASITGDHLMEKNALHIWPRGNFMLIALPNLDGSYTCTLFLPFEGKNSFENLDTDEKIKEFFATTFPDVIPLIPEILEDFHDNPTSSLVTIRCFPWRNGNVLIIGDASHGIVPFYGQGMNSGFEDCRVLNKLLDEHDDNWDEVMEIFQDLRKPDADAIADLALRNFVEMRDLVADDDFLLRKKIEARLHDAFPDEWVPLYTMVTFREDIRYSEALERGHHQARIMDKVMANPNIHEDWEKLDLKAIVDQLKPQ
ncbi:FAD-dependent oxidoreductase [Fulvivirga sedimenti]|uniref:Kynurenine 3-monooxygenase n=1 Tax=Fulvivirga sedimenti TaxID=2879465 RepID=A0A9X1HUY5_9BACT|nr:NAD(P)/FAD-dependent oxidoreductase [Fulvivirga sedimenti]MCA6078146.1 FAD-dependent monooxygenase [Fulvivirga sedimenti]